MNKLISVVTPVIAIGCLLFVAFGTYPKYHPPLPALLEVADTPELRAKGLSGRTSLGYRMGMLFVLDAPAIQCMWNKDVSFPLKVIFMDTSGRPLNTAEMPAHSEVPVCSVSPAKYVVEVNLDKEEAK